MRMLIAVALDGTTATYGDIKEMLERDAEFSTIFATRIGMVAGSLMNRVQEVEPQAPINASSIARFVTRWTSVTSR
jgi:hypothetical protein